MMSGVRVVGCGERTKLRDSEGERDGGWGESGVAFSAQETLQGRGMRSVELHRETVCCKALGQLSV